MHVHRRSLAGVGVSTLLVVLAVAAALFMAMPSSANAAPHHNRGLTIAATPNPITAGEGVLIYGQLVGPNNGDQRIYLYHRINPVQHFSIISITRTNSSGFFEFVRADGIVNSNRNWFVRGPANTHSRTIHEWVSPVVTLAASATTATTGDTETFTGNVFPAHLGQRVYLQEQDSTNGNGWKTIGVGTTNGSSDFSIQHRFRTPGSYTLRAFFPSDPRNIAGQSDDISLTVQQQQNPSFTINASAQPIVNGQSETISGTLYADGSTTTVQPNVNVTLYGHDATGGGFKAIQSSTTDSSGEYMFTTMPLHNTVYRVVATPGHEVTANLFVGVEDGVSASLSSPTTTVGGTVQVSGTITPQHTGHVVYLQELNAANQWVDIQAGFVNAASNYQFQYTPGMAGTFELRVQITGGPWNLGNVSSTVTETVNGVAPVTSLPPAS